MIFQLGWCSQFHEISTPSFFPDLKSSTLAVSSEVVFFLYSFGKVAAVNQLYGISCSLVCYRILLKVGKKAKDEKYKVLFCWKWLYYKFNLSHSNHCSHSNLICINSQSFSLWCFNWPLFPSLSNLLLLQYAMGQIFRIIFHFMYEVNWGYFDTILSTFKVLLCFWHSGSQQI